jgi:hypothetical protein
MSWGRKDHTYLYILVYFVTIKRYVDSQQQCRQKHSNFKVLATSYILEYCSSSLPQILWVLSVDDQVGNGYGVVTEAVKGKVNFLYALLHPRDERGQFTKPILVRFATIDARKREHRVIQHPTNMARLSIGGARQDLADNIRGEGCNLIDKIGLMRHCFSNMNVLYKRHLLVRSEYGRWATVHSLLGW